MRLVIARLNHETNAFSPVPTPLEAFEPQWGAAAYDAARGSRTAMGAFLHLAEGAGADVSAPLFAMANPSGPVDDAAYERMRDELRRDGSDFFPLTLQVPISIGFGEADDDYVLRRVEEAIERRRVTNQSWGFATALIGLGFVSATRGHHQEAHSLLIEGLTHADANGDLRLAGLALAGVASVAVAWGKPRIAARLLGVADRPGASGRSHPPRGRAAHTGVPQWQDSTSAS